MKQAETPCMCDRQLSLRGFETDGELQRSALDSIADMFILARCGRPDLLWTLHMCARSVTTCNRAFDIRLARNDQSISFSIALLEAKLRDCKLGLFQNTSFAGDLQKCLIFHPSMENVGWVHMAVRQVLTS